MMEAIQPHEAQTIYIQFSGRHIRKWSLKPFEGAIKYERVRDIDGELNQNPIKTLSGGKRRIVGTSGGL